MKTPLDKELEDNCCPKEYLWVRDNIPAGWNLIDPWVLSCPVPDCSALVEVIALDEVQVWDAYGFEKPEDMFTDTSRSGYVAGKLMWDTHPLHYGRYLAWRYPCEPDVPKPDITAIVDAANAAFWGVVASMCPTATGDLSPDRSFKFRAAQVDAVSAWIDENV